MTLTTHMVRTVAGFFVLVLVLVWALRPPSAVPAAIAHSACERVTVRDEAGRRLTGIEDLALGPGGTLLMSAYNRQDPEQGDGGLYALNLFVLTSGAPQSAQLISSTLGRSFRPHGFALAPGGARLAVINRPKDGAVEILIGPYDGTRWFPADRIGHRTFCRANDLVYAADARQALDVTIDRGSCGFSVADLVPWAKTGTVVRARPGSVRTVRSDLSFPNGISNGFVAETRAQRLSKPRTPPIQLPGGPDNITLSSDGRLIVAVHPKLLFNWFAQQGWMAQIPSRIVAVDVAQKTVSVLFDDVSGTVFSGATGAVVTGQTLIAGSATDHGLLMCQM